MINANTVKLLKLKSYTMSACKEMYIKFSQEYGSTEAINEVLSWWQDHPQKLNTAWWTLNYHSKELDGDRRLKARIEDMLDNLAQEAEQKQNIEFE